MVTWERKYFAGIQNSVFEEKIIEANFIKLKYRHKKRFYNILRIKNDKLYEKGNNWKDKYKNMMIGFVAPCLAFFCSKFTKSEQA